jgi:two-component system, NtrC family, sensor histidine kinase HydH
MRSRLPAVLRHGGLSIWACIVAAVALVAVLGSAIGLHDVHRHVEARRADEIQQRQSHAERSAAQIASQLLEDGTPLDLSAVKHAGWLRSYWSRTLSRQPFRLYTAVVDLEGTVVAHSDPDREGLRLSALNEQALTMPGGTEQFELVDAVLTGGRRAIDVRVPIKQGEQVIGVYHAGFNADWLDDRMASEEASRSRFWAFLVGGTCGLILLSSIAVVQVTRHTARLEHELEAAHARRVSEMHELVLGIAHEIRNPLNAIRLNLHTVGQVFRDEAALEDCEVATMLGEMESEVGRLDTLMRDMLGFARTSDKSVTVIDVAEEAHRTLSFLRANLDQRHISVRLELDDEPCTVQMSATRLRQVLLNLLNNAIEAVGEGGSIEIAVHLIRSQVEISVADDGPGVAPADRERVFVPFFSTKTSGTGLGLALARKFIEEAGGTLRCEDGQLREGSCFRIVLPATSGAPVEVCS